MVKHRPATGLDYTCFGEFNVPTTIPVNWVFGRINTALGKQFSASQDPVFQACSSRQIEDIQNSNSSAISSSFVSDRASTGLHSCAKCLRPSHAARFCTSAWRCKACLRLGHKACWCLTSAKPRLFWAPKTGSDSAHGKALDASAETNTLDSLAASQEIPQSVEDPSPSPNNSAIRLPPCSSSPQEISASDMANFPCNPMLFVP